jgi:hypothetical protein
MTDIFWPFWGPLIVAVNVANILHRRRARRR